MEVFHQRLEDEHGASVITTSPTVPYRIEFSEGDSVEIQNPSQFPLGRKISAVWEGAGGYDEQERSRKQEARPKSAKWLRTQQYAVPRVAGMK